VAQFARTLAVELGPEGIRVNNVAPDITPTPGMTGGVGGGDASLMDELGARIAIPMGRMGRVEDVSNAVLFLASRLSSYITGTTLHPDGGAIASSGWFNWPGEGFRNTVPQDIVDHVRPAGS
jgi:NAD(P)-dependent dehydrogenase (short-subunit alcohol dehydrogenase family)